MRHLTPALAATQAGVTAVIDAPDGFVAADVQGAGPPIVLVHGMTSPALIFERAAPLLAAAGFTVVRYDLYGRGCSARPEIPLTPDVFARQLDAVIDATCTEPSWVVGYSWGAGLVASWAAKAPSRARGVVLSAPGGTGPSAGWIAGALRARGVGELLVALDGSRGLRADVRQMFNDPATTAAYLPRFEAQLAWEGYGRCFLASLRGCPPTWEAAYAALGATNLPVAVLWGDADRKTPRSGADALLERIPRARLRVIPGGAHGVPWEDPAAFSEALVGELRG